MTTAIIPAPSALLTHAQVLRAARGTATEQRYADCWKAWATWAAANGYPPAMPVDPRAIATWLLSEAAAGRKYYTLRLRVVAMRVLHARHGHKLDTQRFGPISEALAGIARTYGTAQRQAAPLMVEHLRVALAKLPVDALRTRAMLLVGWAGAFRSGELVAIRWEHVTLDAEGMTILLPRSKTDQEGKGRVVPISSGTGATCPVAALERWRAVATGAVVFPVNRRTVDRLCKDVASMNGLDPTKYSSHSLRAGFVTTLRLANADDAGILRVTGHHGNDILNRYDRGAVHLYDRVAKGCL